MKGYKMLEVTNKSDLKQVGLEFLLDSYSIEEITGCYFDDKEVHFVPNNMQKVKIPCGYVVHGRLFIEMTEAYFNGRDYYVTKREFLSHF